MLNCATFVLIYYNTFYENINTHTQSIIKHTCNYISTQLTIYSYPFYTATIITTLTNNTHYTKYVITLSSAMLLALHV